MQTCLLALRGLGPAHISLLITSSASPALTSQAPAPLASFCDLKHVKLNHFSRPLPELCLLPGTLVSQFSSHWLLHFSQDSVLLADPHLNMLSKDALSLTLILLTTFLISIRKLTFISMTQVCKRVMWK